MTKTLTVTQEVPIPLECDVLVVGRAAGVAAAEAAEQGLPVNEVDTSRIQDKLRRQNTLLEMG